MAVTPGNQPENARIAQDRAWAQWALQRWAAFPVSSRPRPLILTGPPTRMDHGFRSGDAKLAFLYGDIQTEVQLPDGLLDVLRRDRPGPREVPGKRRWKDPLLITEARPDQAEFATDRGGQVLPAWRLGGPAIDGALWVLAPEAAARRWIPPEPAPPRPVPRNPPHRGTRAAIQDDGRTLHYTFTGAAPEFAEYPAAETVETSQALAVLPIEHDIGPAGLRTLVGWSRTVTVRLASPLGERVVVDLDASPLMVLARDAA